MRMMSIIVMMMVMSMMVMGIIVMMMVMSMMCMMVMMMKNMILMSIIIMMMVMSIIVMMMVMSMMTMSMMMMVMSVMVMMMHAIVCFNPLPDMYNCVNSNYPDYKFKTSVIWDHKDARWTDSIIIPLPTEKTVRAGWGGDASCSSTTAVTTDLEGVGTDHWSDSMLIVKVFDKERLRRKTLLGVVSVKLTKCFYA